MRGMSKKDALACQVSLGLFAGLLGIASTAHGAPSLDDKGVRVGGATVNVGTTTVVERIMTACVQVVPRSLSQERRRTSRAAV